MQPPRFDWRCSYREQADYRVYGFSGLRHGAEIEEYRILPEWDQAYGRKTYNGTPEQFAADYIARLGGVTLRESPYRMPAELYDAFIAWRKAKHDDNERHILAHPEKYGDYRPDPLFIPRPIYYNHDAKTWKDEPWYTERMKAYGDGQAVAPRLLPDGTLDTEAQPC
jgi:hypothetical protein